MPVINGVGQSEYTKTKEEHYAKLLGMHVNIAERAMRNNLWSNSSYLLIDATAGSGILEDGTPGSPIIAINRLRKMSTPFKALFIEEQPEVFAQLDLHVSQDDNVQLRWARYQDIIGEMALRKDRNQLGLLYIDPNGTPDFDALCQFARARPRMEILISVTATGYKRSGKVDRHLDEWLRRIGKQYWLIRKPYTAWHWTFLLGSDYAGFNKPYKGIEVEPVTSELGKGWLECASYTVTERLGKVQPPLTGLMPNTCDTQPIGRSGPWQSSERAASVSDARRDL